MLVGQHVKPERTSDLGIQEVMKSDYLIFHPFPTLELKAYLEA